MNALTGKVAIVTGASKGIGAAIAEYLAAEGAAVVVNYARDKEGADNVVAVIVSKGGQAIAVQADVASMGDVQRLFVQAKNQYGRLDVLVNNAGVFHFEPLRDVTVHEFHRQFDVNVLGVILTTQKALEYFDDLGGSVINISSVASRNPVANSVVYASSKAAVDTITLTLAKELGARRIRVNTIAPGGVATEGTRANGVVGSDEERRIVGLTPLGRFGEPQDIAKVAVFLASEQSAWVTGERISVSGGWF
jgi:3-oxoacyl-[acyl-carrier protein] reductase